MSINELLATLKALDIQLAVKDGQLAVQGNRRALSDNGLVEHLRTHKAALIELLEEGRYSNDKRGQPTLPANGITADCTRITPEMLTLVAVDQTAIDGLVELIPGGAANVQDIYPLAPLQQGILYHHVSASGRDPYVMRVDFAVADAQRLEAFAQALQTVIDRHDILRTSVHWQGLERPLQVVWRNARLSVEQRADSLDAEAPVWLDLTQAPLLRLVCGRATDGRVQASLLYHHIALDHSALEVVRQEIQACLLGLGATLGTPVPFRNYVGQALLGVSEAEHEAFFRGMLGDVVEPTLAYGLQDLSGDGEQTREHSITLDTALSLRLRAQARSLGVSVASLFHLGWAHVLAGLTGRQRVVFGTVLMGRLLGAEATERALGIFINTLPLCLNLEAQEMAAAIRTTHQRLTTLMRHEHAPLALAQRCSGVAAPTPLFNALLNYRHSSAEHGSGELWQGIEVLQATERSNYPVVMSVDDLGEAFAFTAQTIAGVDPLRTCLYLQRAMQQMLEALEQAPAVSCARLDILPDDERIELLQDFAGARSAYESLHTVHWRIEAQAFERPNAIAAQAGDATLSYAELNARANGLAHHLIELGVRPDERVAVLARRGLDTLVGLLAVLKAGAGYVPVDPAHPDERIAYLLSDSAPRVVLTQQDLLERVPAMSAPLLLLDQPSWGAREDNPQVPGLNARHLAYVIYTSGSTGQPKGVMVEHQSFNNLVDWHCQAFDLHAGSHTASVAGFGFDAMAWEVWPALCAGATLHLPPAHIGNEQLDALLDWWQAQPLQVAFLPTPVAEYAFSRELKHPTLRTLLIGGDRLRQFPRDPGFAVINNYGPTETTVVASSGRLWPEGRLDIGKPIANTRLYLLDEYQQLVPSGVAGELYIGGEGVARGYLNRADLTAERFLDDPFVAQPGARMYRTGDLARWNADGTLDYLGRNDDQVKIRGMRIELGEIESQLGQMLGVEEALVLAREDVPGQPRLVAYFTGPQALSASDLRSALLSQLPGYMVPSAFVHLAAWPLTANGKVDRRALPAPEREALSECAFEAPQGETEEAIAQIWQSLLGVERVGRDDGFLDLGGHSLLTMQLQARLLQKLGVQLDLQTLFTLHSLRELAAYVDQAKPTELQAIEPISRNEPVPLSLAQQRLWFLDQLDPAASLAYHMPANLRLRGELNVDALKQALDRIVARHESLRARFPQAGSVQFAPADCGFNLVEHDLRGQPAEAVDRQRIEEARTPFDLSNGPLVRGRLLRTADDEHLLLVTQHHIVSDGWSVGVMIGEFNRLYAAFSQGQADPLPPLALQYADYAAWQQQQLQGERLQRQLDFWQQHLSDAPALLELPADRPRPAEQSYRGAALAVQLPSELSQRLRQFSQQQGLTPFMTLLGAWSILLSRLSNQAQVVVGTPVANRTRQETEALIGFFVNTLALRLDLAGHNRVDELLAHIKAITLQAYEHQAVPFEQVVEVLQPERSLGHSPLFQAMLVLGNTPQDQAIALPGVELTALTPEASTTQFDLTLALNDDGQTFSGQFEYATDLFDASTIARWREHLLCLLDAMLASAEQPVTALPLLTPAQAAQQQKAFSGPLVALDERAERLPQRVFQAQAARTPDALAVASTTERWSYAQLNARANQVAHWLIDQGVGPDDTVGLCASRSPQMVAGLLGILKAGAAYVPLDANYPAERLAYMLADSAPGALVCEAGLSLAGAAGLPTLVLGSPDQQQAASHDPQAPAPSFEHLAYVIYTSGSTGKPKGVMVEHRGLRNLLDWYLQDLALDANDAVLLASSYNFDLTQKNILAPLMVGAALHLATEPFDPVAIVAHIHSAAISHLNLSPSAFRALVEADPEQRMAGLRRVVLGGEPIQLNVLEKLALPRPQFINSYGPTECSDVVAWHRLDSDLDHYREQPIPIGLPIRNLQLYVLDAHGQVLPIGVTGEIHIGGVGVARGYLNRPDLTAERFIDTLQGRLYKTGDLGRWAADGTLEYLGRNDEQLKIRGLRVEPGEIEAALASLPGVREAALVARDSDQGKQLVAYLCGEPGEPAQLREALASQLPAHMLPAAFVILPALPLTPNGKLDRRALPEPDAKAWASSTYEAPQGPLEQALAEHWQALLGVPQVGRQDNFFALGGHSMMAVSLIERLRGQGLNADVRTLFSAPTLKALAQTLSDSDGQHGRAPANLIAAGCTQITPDLLPLVSLEQADIERIVAQVPGGAANVQDIYPLGPLQAGILYHHHLAAGEADPYLLEARFAFASAERLEAFCAALQRVIERHDILRTALHWDDLQTPVQVVWRQVSLPVQEVTLAALDGPARMDLTQAPLLHLAHARDEAAGRIIAVLRFHHAIMDHIGLEVLGHEVQAMLLGEEAQLPESVPYRNYIAQVLQGPDEQAHEAFFREQLGDIDEPSLPYGMNASHSVQAPGVAELPLDPALALRLRGLARQLNVSAASLMHLAWAEVLGQLSGRKQVVFGTVLLGRLLGGEGAERAMGVFINTLPLRIDLGELSARDAVLDTHQRLSALLVHEQAQLALAQRCSALPAGTPLFSTLLNFRHSSAAPSDAERGSAWQGIEVLQAEEHSNYPLTMSIDDLGEAFLLTARTQGGLDAQRICAYLQQALGELVRALEQHPQRGLEGTIIPPHERQRLLATFNDTRLDYPREQAVHQLFEQRAALHPQAVALVHGRRALSYEQLNERANALAHHLRGQGIQPGDHVGILLPRSAELVIAQLAIGKCAATYVPLDVNAPSERHSYMLEDCAAVCLLTQSELEVAASIRRIDLDELPLNPQALHNLDLPHAADSAAYVMYTSGSTGLPKGVRVGHRGIVRLVVNNGYAEFSARDCFALASNPAFDASTLEVWGALLNGGQLLVIDHAILVDPQRFASVLRQGGVSVLFLTTALFNQYAQLLPQALAGLRVLLSGGERANPATYRALLAHAPNTRLFNAYGPTETTTFATAYEVREVEADVESLPIGRPISNTRVYVLDARQRLAPMGVVGELYIGGDGVALGYLNRAELNAEKFLADPFSDQPGAMMYRTGDLGRWLEDGQLECLGRNDDQVKIRGFRIELGEIANALQQLPGVRDAVALAREDEPGQVRLVAYFTATEAGQTQTAQQMRAQLQTCLPDYMVPSAFVELKTLPLTANGKLDQRALPKPDHSSLVGLTYEAPQGEMENALAAIWAEVLQVERVGRHDHFFDLGGHSLLAMRMVSQVRQQLGVELPLGELFTLGELAAVAAALAKLQAVAVEAIHPVPRGDASLLSFAQQRLWFLTQMEGGSQAYNIPMALELRGPLDVAALQGSLARIVERHETLRSRFVTSEQGAEVVFVFTPMQLPLEDLRERPQALHERLAQLAVEPFDLSCEPALRACLLCLGDDHHVLSLTVHHIVADGWSMGVLTRELLALYPVLRQGQADPLPALAIQYADFAAWQQNWLSGERLQRQAAYWRQTLQGAPTLLSLPTDRPRPAQQDFAGASLALSLDARLAAGLRALAQRQGVTLYMTLMAAWAALLARLSGQADVVVGSPIAGRNRVELEPLIGLFVNTLAIRLDLSAAPTGEALLAQVRSRVLEAQDHQDLPFEQVVESVAPARSLAHSPLFQTTLNWLAGETTLPAMDGLALSLVEQSSQVAKFDLSLNLGECGDVLVGTLDYATALFDEASVRRYGRYFETLLQALVNDEQCVIGAVPLVSGDERDTLLDTFNASAMPFAAMQTLHQRIEAQAFQRPAAIAAQVGDATLSYAELNARANGLAHHLIELGVRPDERVAVLARRGLDTLVGLLAVLKAGAGYVPVDPAHPDERIAYLLSDSAPRVVLTQQDLLERVPALSVPVVRLDQPSWSAREDNPQVPGLNARHLAYVIYTSGSTGQPKGVMVEHQSLNNLVDWHCQTFDLGAGSHTASVAGFGFDAMAWEVWPALCAGATLHLPPAHIGNEQLDALLDWWQAQPLQVAFLPTPVAEYAFSRELKHPTLRTLLIGGDRLRQFPRDPGFAVINNYGPTETTVVASSGRLWPNGRLDIGKPIANTRLYLLDEHQQLVPSGVAGELYIGGEGVARGYLNRADLTAERFLDDPFVAQPGARMYRTGDLARWNADGTLDYLGRNDDQVKIRGMRIELGEIESQLGQVPGVEEALVLAREDVPGQPRLVAYFTGPQALSASDLRSALLSKLPGYMVPSAFVHLAAWPLTANGKVDRRALPAPEREALPERAFEEPQGELESTLAAIWCELLQVERVGRHDHFFELGGHSMLAVTLIARLRALGLEANVRVLFAQPTLAALAASIGADAVPATLPENRIPAGCQHITPDMLTLVKLEQPAIERIVAAVPGGAANVQDIYPLGPLQAGIFYHYLARPDDDPYRLQARFAFADRARLQAFCQALRQVVARHDALRTALFWEGLEAPVQVVWRQAELTLHEVPLAKLDDLAALDLQRAPLLSLAYAEDSANQRILAVLSFHHLIMDHLGLELLGQELQALLLDQGAALREPVPYRNYIAQTLSGPGQAAHEAFFREQLGDIDEPTLPYGPTALHSSQAPGEARQRLDAALCQRIREQVRASGVSPASLMHLAWAQVLGQLSGRDKVVFGTVLLGRLQGGEGVERTLGVFINTLPLRVDLADQSVQQALLQTHKRLTGLLAHEHAPLALAQRASALPAGAPLFSALLNYRHSSRQEGTGEAWQGIELLQAKERSSYPLTVSVDDLGDRFEVTALTANGIDAQRVCSYLVCAVQQLLLALEQEPEKALSGCGVLPETERHELLERFNPNYLMPTDIRPVHQRVEHQALERPDAIAAQVGEAALSYAELNARANGLAHQLIELGVRPDERVAVLARRGLDTLVGLLAVLKAGAGYVPVDPAHPDERIAYLLSDSAPRVVLSQLDLLERVPALSAPVVLLDQPSWSARENNPQVPGLNARHLAYVIYTSGSTGQPKGVMVEHQSLNNLVDWHCQAFDLQAGSHTASVAGFGFDAMAWEVWPALCAGATLHLPPAPIGNEQLDALLDWWQAQPLQVAFLPTPVAEYAFSRELKHPTLRTLLIGGDRLRQFPRDPGFAVVNNYGPTETTVVASSGLMQPGGVLHIGKPVTHARLYVLDARQQPVPVGVPGELYIGGDGVARGYLNRADLTAERFLDDQFSTQPGARMYRSGDLVRWLDDGTLDYLGRNDDQVKIRGVRIELGEIEQHLAQCPGIGEAVVVTQHLNDASVRLVAYFTRRDAALDGAAIRSHLLERLPEYMVPALYMGLDALPLTQNGKVDRRALPDLAAHEVGSAASEPPRTELEQRLAECWMQVLQTGPIGRCDSFFELGGHSLSAIQLVSLLQDEGLSVTLAELFQRPSIAALAELLEQRPAKAAAQSIVEVRAGSDEPALFLFHDFTGLDAYFPVLAQHLPGDFPVYGLPGVALGQPQLRTMECMAARMIEHIRSVQPSGPYRLAGWSFGGVLAYEVATQLSGMDETVSFIGLIDSYIPRLTDQGKARWEEGDALQRHLLAHCLSHWKSQCEQGRIALDRLDGWQAQAKLPGFDQLLQVCRDEGLLYEELAKASDLTLRHYLEREVAHGHALANYQLQPLGLPVHVFCAEERDQAPAQASANNGWETVLPAPYLQRVSVPGDHMSLMRAPHVAVLAQALGEAICKASLQRPTTPAHAALLAIQSGQGDRTPLFCVPGAGDSVTSFIGLAEALGSTWPIFALQHRGLDGRSLPHSRVEAAARCYVAALEAHYPQGPVHLLGHSFGGWVAHAMAGLLEAKGREVCSLTLIDSEAPNGEALCGKAYTSTEVLKRLIEALELSGGRSLGIDAQAFVEHDDSTQMRLLEEAMVRVGLLPPRLAGQAVQGIVRTFGSALRSEYRPQPGAYSGPANLVLVADAGLDELENRLEQASVAAAWQQILPAMNLWHGPGDHFSILKAPDVYSLAAWWYEAQASSVEKALS